MQHPSPMLPFYFLVFWLWSESKPHLRNLHPTLEMDKFHSAIRCRDSPDGFAIEIRPGQGKATFYVSAGFTCAIDDNLSQGKSSPYKPGYLLLRQGSDVLTKHSTDQVPLGRILFSFDRVKPWGNLYPRNQAKTRNVHPSHPQLSLMPTISFKA
jgi:hypothetical protein